MRDTSPGMDRLHRELLMQRSPVERLEMACSMFETARALALAGLRREHPDAPEDELEDRMFLRFYGADLGPELSRQVLEATRRRRLRRAG